MAGRVGIEAPGLGDGHGEALGAHEFGERVEAAGDPPGSGPADLLGESLGRLADASRWRCRAW